MPIHDWTRVDAGLFHAFHHGWIEELARALNRGVLPGDYFALPEQNIRDPIPDVLTLELAAGKGEPAESAGGTAVAVRTPRTHLTRRAEADSYIRKASRITVRYRHGKVIAVIEMGAAAVTAYLSETRRFST